MRVLSLFDGMSCGQIALRDMGITPEVYFASEVDKFAIAQTQLNFPDTIQLGDVRLVDPTQLGHIDLLIGGSPCQSFSFAGKRVGMATKENEKILTLERYMELKEQGFEFEGQSYLFWEYMRILTELKRLNPNVKFLLENVKMKKEWEKVLTDAIGVPGVHINSALVSAQNRKRIYWTNIGTIAQPEDRGLLLRDVLQTEVDEKYFLKDEVVKNLITHRERNKAKGNGFGAVFQNIDKKANSVTVGGKGEYDLVEVNKHLAKNLTPTDEKAQCFLATSWKGAWANGMTLVETLNEDCGDLKDFNKRIGGITCDERGIRFHRGDKRKTGISELGRIINSDQKSDTVITSHVGMVFPNPTRIRRLTPTECARLQTIPEWYKWACSETQQYKMLGNGWTVEVIKHIFSYLER